MRQFKPDTIIALGGGSPMDASKVMWLLYEHPEIEFSDMREKFFDVRKRAFKFPDARRAGQARLHPDDVGHRRRDDAVRGHHRPRDGHEVPARRLRADPDGRDHRPGADGQDAALPRRRRRLRRADARHRGVRVGVRERLHRRPVPARDQADLREHRAQSVERRARPTERARPARRCTTRAPSPAWPSATRSSGSCTRWPTSSAPTLPPGARPDERDAAAARHPLQRHHPDEADELAEVRALRRAGALPGDREAPRSAGVHPGRGRRVLRPGRRGAARPRSASPRRSRRRASTRRPSSASSTTSPWAPTTTSARRPTRGCR